MDDLRPELGCYGVVYAVTPHIGCFASAARVFNKAYVAVAVCALSRDSLLTGLRPVNTGCCTIPDGPHWHRNPSHIALLCLFKDNGYTVSGFGRIAHNKAAVDMRSWSRFDYLRRMRFADPAWPSAMNRSLMGGRIGWIEGRGVEGVA